MMKALDRSTPIPLYYQLKSLLLQDIQNGVYAVGDRIPTEAELQEQFQVSRSTIRQALHELTNEGWLQRQASKGTFVAHPDKSKTLIRSFEPFYQRVSKSGKTPRTEVLELSVIEANEFLADSMQLAVGDKVVTMMRRRFMDDEAVVTVRNYLPFHLCSFILSHNFKVESLYEVLMQNPQSRIKKTRSIVSAEKATAEDIQLLGVKPDCPILAFANTTVSQQDVVVDLAFSHYRGYLNGFELESSPE